MKLTTLELTNFRNIPHAKLEFEGNRHFFLGANGQGKTNILEAIAFAQSLKSFRTSKREALVGLGHAEAVLRGVWQHEKLGETTLGVSLTALDRRTVLDGKNIPGPQEVLGVFPVIALSLADRELLYGEPDVRRREIDGLISHIDPEYPQVLAAYNEAMKNRNALLGKLENNSTTGKASAEEFESFESQMAVSGRRVIKSRVRAAELLLPYFRAAFASFSPTGELPDLIYQPNAPAESLADLWRSLRTQKDKERGHTTRGPHRDDYWVNLNGVSANMYASEGQKFSLVLALKLAGMQLLYEKLRVAPVLVCDDLLLELDAGRQEKFWESLGELQVFASGTVPPIGKGWKVWEVSEGKIMGSR